MQPQEYTASAALRRGRQRRSARAARATPSTPASMPNGRPFIPPSLPPLRRLRIAPSQIGGLRHRRKYAEGDLGEERSFYFRGPEGRLNLRAQNLLLFTQLAEGVDDETWTYHLRRHDYSRWFRDAIKDDILEEEAFRIENRDELLPEESRTRMKEAVTRLYTLPTIVSAAVSSATNPEIGSRPQINPVQSTKVSSPGRGRSRKL